MKFHNVDWNSIVPQSQSLDLRPGSLAIAELCLTVNGPFAAEAILMAQRHPQLQDAAASAVHMQFEERPGLGEEGYQIDIMRQSVAIFASSPAGAFYATMTLSQWLWQHSALPLAKLSDQPRFSWRGYMLDVSRHFFPLSYLKELMQQLASYKINRFHLHLSDDQGWRLPVEKYPRLTELGSKCYWTTDHFYHDEPGERGFYSKEQIAELNDWAAQLHMVIVPEIDLPGHATAALVCYPELICKPFQGNDLKVLPFWGISQNVLCLAKPETWDFVYAVLDELVELFPGPYIHLGGDEVMREHWQDCPDCQKMIQTEGLGDCDGLQNLFTQRSRDYLRAKGKTPLYWDEVEESGLSEGTICCFWRSWSRPPEGAGQAGDNGASSGKTWDIRAARKGVAVISCPVEGTYLDYKHSRDPHEPGNISVLTVYDSYHFLPLADKSPDLAPHNLGVQGNLWTECLSSPRHVEYMSYPRILAIAEQGWHKGGWPLFQAKWSLQQRVLEAQGVRNYYRGPWD